MIFINRSYEESYQVIPFVTTNTLDRGPLWFNVFLPRHSTDTNAEVGGTGDAFRGPRPLWDPEGTDLVCKLQGAY